MPDGTDDILAQAQTLLRGLNLLGSKQELAEAGELKSVFRGPPDSVALIEAGATAAAKWWAAGLGGGAVTAWASVRAWWGSAGPANQQASLWVAAIVTAAAVAGIAYLLGSDVRGRAAVATETVRARAHVAEVLVGASREETAERAEPADDGVSMVSLPLFAVRHIDELGGEERGWRAVALASDGHGRNRYLIVKGALHKWVPADRVQLPAG